VESVALAEKLRAAGTSVIELEKDVWPGIIQPLLPAARLTQEFLEKTLAPLPGHGKAKALEILAKLGRKEIADYAATLIDGEPEGSLRLSYAGTLLKCRDARGYGILEELYRRSMERPLEKPGSVPVAWIYDTLQEQGPGDAKAMECAQRLGAMRNEREMMGDAKQGRRVGDFVFKVTVTDLGASCSAAERRYDPLAIAFSFWWHQDADKFTIVLEHRSRCKKRGCAVTYAEAGRGKVPEGKVLVAAAGMELLLDRAFFEQAATTFASTAIELTKEGGRPVAEGLEDRLRAVRARA
jgi:hypothetical protein